MPYLMRVELPDVPGSLGRLATAIGEAGGDIEAIEIVEKGIGTAVDDVLLETPTTTMPDSIVSACEALPGVKVIWISRYAAGGNLFLDLEAVETLTEVPSEALKRVVHVLPETFRTDWAARVHRVNGIVDATENAPDALDFIELEQTARIEFEPVGGTDDTGFEPDETLYAATRVDGNEIIVVGRRGGPEFLDSELARLAHLVGLASTIARG